MRDFTRHERNALDRWLTTDPNDDGLEWCGDESVHDPHGNCPGKTYPGRDPKAPQPATGSTMARDNDPAFRPI
jgi:hypothetical protein